MNSPNKTKTLSYPAGLWRLIAGWALGIALAIPLGTFAQDAQVTTQMDARQITVGDQVHLFIHVQNDDAKGRLQWAAIPDTFNSLEIVERSKIDTQKQGGLTIYKQRLTITGFDSGMFKVPSFVFPVIPASGTAYTVQSDSLPLVVMTVPVDTTKAFKGIKGIIYVKSTWKDYIWYIVGGIALILVTALIVAFFVRRQMRKPKPVPPQESLHDRTLRLLSELEARQLWQKKQVKEYYIELTDIVRSYIEKRFDTQAMELTTDEILEKAAGNAGLQPFQALLASILHTADLAKFAKAQPLPQEHIDALANARLFVSTSKPAPPPAPATAAPGTAQQPAATQQPASNTPPATHAASHNDDKNSESPTGK